MDFIVHKEGEAKGVTLGWHEGCLDLKKDEEFRTGDLLDMALEWSVSRVYLGSSEAIRADAGGMSSVLGMGTFRLVSGVPASF